MAETRTPSEEMQAFYREIASRSMDALWNRAGGGGPRRDGTFASYQPAYWDGADIATYIKRAGELFDRGPMPSDGSSSS